LQDTTLSGNSGNHGGAAYIGGFLSNNNSDIQNSQFFNNRANDGGGALYYSSDGTELTIANSTFTGNEVESTATSSGGAILISGYSLAISITNSHFMHNDSRVYAGGAIHNFADNSSFTVANTTFISNTANTIGGAFSSGGDNVVSMISDSTFTNNSSSFSGGAIHIQALTNTVTIADSYFSQNLASYYGGAIRLYGAGPTFEKIGVTAHIADSTLEGNIATLGGGALASGVGTFTAITNTAFVYNMSDGNGGAFHISSDGTMGGAYGHIANSTFSHNQTAQSGGAIYGYNSSTNLSFRNTTIAYNVADSDSDGVGSGGGVTLDNMPQFTFGNSLIANNIDNGNEAPDCAATFGFFSVTNNLISKSNGCDFTPQPTDIVGTIADPINPILEPLTGNPAYHPLGVGSPAIDNGSPSPLLDPSSNLTSCLTTDQIYTPRAIDGNGDGEAICDIGAIEAPSPFEGLYIYLPLVLLP